MKGIHSVKVFVTLAAALLLTAVAAAQQAPATGTPAFSSMGGGPFDSINLGNLNIHFAIPVRHKAGRGLPLTYDLTYDSSVWYSGSVNGVQTWQPVQNGYWGWTGLSSGGLVSNLTYSTTYASGNCGQSGQYQWQSWTYSNFVYTDNQGTHPVPSFSAAWIDVNNGTNELNCPANGATPSTQAIIPINDGSGLTFYALVTGQNQISWNVTNPTGTSFYNSYAGVAQTDANGNEITSSAGVITDTLNQAALTISGSAPSNTLLQYTAPSGGTAQYTVSYKGYTVKTNFNCGGIAEYNTSNIYLVDKVTLPDSTFYQFSYEQTAGGVSGQVTGRLASVTLPTGGTITYTYPTKNGGANNSINCSDGTVAASVSGAPSLTRVLNPGGTWAYSRTQVSGNHWQTTVTDPANDQTLVDLQKDGGITANFFETERQAYQGSVGGTILNTRITCYNTLNPTASNCPGASVSTPINRITAFSYLPNASGNQSETDTQYGYVSDPSFPTEVDTYNYGSATVGSLLQKVITVYGAYGSTIRPTSVQTQDGAGHVQASTTYAYDEGMPVSTNEPQHTSVGGGRGNLTTLSTQVNGSLTLTRKFTYFDTGNINTASDQGTTTSGGSNITTYTYGACGNAFVTNIAEPVNSMTRSFTWDCSGGVMTSATDENLQTTQVSYSDPYFWRPATSTDALSNVTHNTYSGATQVESYMNFSAATNDVLSTVDGLGRAVFSQKRQAQAPGSSTFDSTQTGYGWTTTGVTGPFTTVSVPYSAGAAQGAPGGTAVTTTQYDAIGRVSSRVDGGGGSISYSYVKNDALQTVGPTRTFQKQLEYDSLGRVSSVCEVSSTSGSGGCGQSNPQTGFSTEYSYNALGNLTAVTQNAQSGTQQARSYTYDMLGRLLTEQNPETGSITYVYDSWDSSCGSYSSPGDLVEKKDAVGNVTCMKYDGLHRATQITYPAGSYASRTPTKCFVYDSATVNGTAMSNAKTRLAEAYTTSASSCPGTPIVDEGLSYSARGEQTDLWEKTPNSGGYYHPTAGYWANGALESLWISSLPAITYNVDGEGRTATVSASSGQNPVSLTNYNTAGQVTKVTFGSGDGDEFFYDSHTGRMTQYKLWANGSNEYGNLGWNANGTLGSLNITDPFNAGDNQSCNYAYDDLVRLSSVNCGSAWSQSFTYDAFGNITKSGSISWQPGYSPSTNRYTLGGTSYDADGNLLNDSFHSYTWDSDSNPATIDAIGLTYDAFDRVVEQNQSGTYYQIVYTPTGTKLGKFKAGVMQQVYVPLPGGANAEYYSWGLSNYRHADWLGSDRMQTDASSRSVTDNNAYAPFGEPYAQTGNGEISFTGQNKDTDWLQYDFLMRQYDPKQGRWISPDPAGMGAVDPTNPQSWNRYAYVENSPVAYIDPDGLAGYSFVNGCLLHTYDYFVDGNYSSSQTFIVACNLYPNGPPSGCSFIGLYGGGFGGVACSTQPPTTGGGSSSNGNNNAANNCPNCHVPNYKKPLSCDVDPCTPEQKKQWCDSGKGTTGKIQKALDAPGKVFPGPVNGKLAPLLVLIPKAVIQVPAAAYSMVDWINGRTSDYFNEICSQ